MRLAMRFRTLRSIIVVSLDGRGDNLDGLAGLHAPRNTGGVAIVFDAVEEDDLDIGEDDVAEAKRTFFIGEMKVVILALGHLWSLLHRSYRA
jgi:hypothetical protein